MMKKYYDGVNRQHHSEQAVPESINYIVTEHLDEEEFMSQFNNIDDIINFLKKLATVARTKSNKEAITFFYNVSYPTLTEYLGELRIVLKNMLEHGEFQKYRNEISELINVINDSLKLSNEA